jgi:hypothetical protein
MARKSQGKPLDKSPSIPVLVGEGDAVNMLPGRREHGVSNRRGDRSRSGLTNPGRLGGTRNDVDGNARSSGQTKDEKIVEVVFGNAAAANSNFADRRHRQTVMDGTLRLLHDDIGIDDRSDVDGKVDSVHLRQLPAHCDVGDERADRSLPGDHCDTLIVSGFRMTPAGLLCAVG